MIELKHGFRTIDLPYTVGLYGVDEAMFDEMVDENTKAELLDGVMIVHSPASLEHDDVTGFIRSLMRLYASKKKLGKVLGPDSLVRLVTGRRFGPDAYFVRQENVPGRWQKQFEGLPDLMLEMLSPSNRDFDLEEKRPAYREAGVPEIWFLDTENQQVIINRKKGKRYAVEQKKAGRVRSTVLKGFWIEVGWLNQDPLPDELECLEAILDAS